MLICGDLRLICGDLQFTGRPVWRYTNMTTAIIIMVFLLLMFIHTATTPTFRTARDCNALPQSIFSRFFSTVQEQADPIITSLRRRATRRSDATVRGPADLARCRGNWTFHSFVSSPPGRFAPKTFRSLDVLPLGRFAIWTVHHLDGSPPRRFATRTFRYYATDDSPPDWRIIFVNNTNDCVAIANIIHNRLEVAERISVYWIDLKQLKRSKS